MRSINYSPPPSEPSTDELSKCGVLKDYSIRCCEYPKAYNLTKYLNALPMCEYSRPMDDFAFVDGVIYSNWVIFLTCRPTDALRLQFVIDELYPYDVMMEEYA